MKRQVRGTQKLSMFIALMTVVLWAGTSLAFNQFSQNGGDATNCGTCHGNFRSPAYTSNSDGQVWGNLHNIHRQTMLSGDCATCHQAADTFPVVLNSSEGGDGLDPLGCMGCHGRAADNTMSNPEVSMGSGSGYGAGLRQRHFTAGVTVCDNCHLDADPAAYGAAPEDVLPPYYANPGNNHPAMPTSACNEDGSEDFAGSTTGLDNDGDLVYDGDDTDCSATGADAEPSSLAMLFQNTPNPFNPQTKIRFTLPVPAAYTLSIHDTAGRLVDKIIGQGQLGSNVVLWDAKGGSLPSGIYFYELEAGSFRETKRMVLIK